MFEVPSQNPPQKSELETLFAQLCEYDQQMMLTSSGVINIAQLAQSEHADAALQACKAWLWCPTTQQLAQAMLRVNEEDRRNVPGGHRWVSHQHAELRKTLEQAIKRYLANKSSSMPAQVNPPDAAPNAPYTPAAQPVTEIPGIGATVAKRLAEAAGLGDVIPTIDQAAEYLAPDAKALARPIKGLSFDKATAIVRHSAAAELSTMHTEKPTQQPPTIEPTTKAPTNQPAVAPSASAMETELRNTIADLNAALEKTIADNAALKLRVETITEANQNLYEKIKRTEAAKVEPPQSILLVDCGVILADQVVKLRAVHPNFAQKALLQEYDLIVWPK